MKTYWRSGGIAPRVLNLRTERKCVVRFTTRPFTNITVEYVFSYVCPSVCS